jgi:hypothetical protein
MLAHQLVGPSRPSSPLAVPSPLLLHYPLAAGAAAQYGRSSSLDDQFASCSLRCSVKRRAAPSSSSPTHFPSRHHSSTRNHRLNGALPPVGVPLHLPSTPLLPRPYKRRRRHAHHSSALFHDLNHSLRASVVLPTKLFSLSSPFTVAGPSHRLSTQGKLTIRFPAPPASSRTSHGQVPCPESPVGTNSNKLAPSLRLSSIVNQGCPMFTGYRPGSYNFLMKNNSGFLINPITLQASP